MTAGVNGILMKDRPPIILPVENQAREFDGKLLLACVAAERGFPAMLGCHFRIGERMHAFPTSVYVAKAVSAGSMKLFRIARQLGHALTAWDEEALVYMSPGFYLRRKTSPEALGTPGALFAWGEDNAAIWRDAPGYRGQPLFTTGNPRGDLLRPDIRDFYRPAADALKRRFGEFVLVNSNFGGINFYFPAISQARLALIERAGKEQVPEEKLGTWDDPGMIASRHAVFLAFQEMLPALAQRLPDRNIVLRPHPSESHEVWRRIAEPWPNLHVISEGNIVPWLLAASVVVHNGCTTGLEAFLLGRRVLAYKPFRDPVYDMDLPDSLSEPVRDPDELARAIASPAPDGAAQEDRIRIADRFVASREGPLASDRIVDAIEGLVAKGGLFPQLALRDRIAGQIASRRRAIKKWRNARKADHFDGAAYVKHRFPDLSAGEVEAQIARLRAVTGRFGRVTVRERWKNVFLLTASA